MTVTLTAVPVTRGTALGESTKGCRPESLMSGDAVEVR